MEDESGDSKHQPIDWFDTRTITALVTAFICDLLFFLVIPHYFGAMIAIPIIWPKTRGWLAKLMLILAFILPLPVLMIGIFLAILFSNKVIAFLATQAAAILAAVATAPAGGAGGVAVEAAAAGAEGTALAVEGAEAAVVAARAGGAVAGAVETGAEVGEGAVAATRGAEAAGEATRGTEAVGETAETTGEATKGTESGARESWRDKALRKAKEKIREKVEQGLGDEEDEDREPTEEEIAEAMEDIAKQAELDRMLGEPVPVMEGLQSELFAVNTGSQNGASSRAGEEEEGSTSRPGPKLVPGNSTRSAPMKKDTQDIITKSRQKDTEFEKNRNIGGKNDQDMPMAA